MTLRSWCRTNGYLKSIHVKENTNFCIIVRFGVLFCNLYNYQKFGSLLSRLIMSSQTKSPHIWFCRLVNLWNRKLFQVVVCSQCAAAEYWRLLTTIIWSEVKYWLKINSCTFEKCDNQSGQNRDRTSNKKSLPLLPSQIQKALHCILASIGSGHCGRLTGSQ